MSAGTDLVRLNLRSVEALEHPIPFTQLLEGVPARVRPHVERILASGGKLPPKSLGAVVDAILRLQPGLAHRLERFSDRRAEILSDMTETVRANLAVQKETFATALQIAGIGTEELSAWSPGQTVQRSFLEGLPEAYVREDTMLATDFASLPGCEAISNLPFAARVFQSASNPAMRLTVVMANRLPLEQQTGADLIYYNETYQSFVMVQYKAMERGSHGWEFRWQANDQFADEIGRMDNLLHELGLLPQDNTPVSFRLHSNPFFLKLCPRIIFNPEDKGLFPGMYLPLDLWRSLAGDPSTAGPRGGRVLSYDNVGRKLTNTEFVSLVADACVGTTVSQSSMLRQVIESVIQSGRTVTFAVKSQPPVAQHVVEDLL